MLNVKNQGLHNKYIITKTNGKPIDPNAEFFVLRLDKEYSDREFLLASRFAIGAFSDKIKDTYPELSKDLKEKYPVQDLIDLYRELYIV